MNILLHPPDQVTLEIDYQSIERNKGQYIVRCLEPTPRYFRMPAAYCNNMQQITATLRTYNDRIKKEGSLITFSITKNAQKQLNGEALFTLEEMVLQ